MAALFLSLQLCHCQVHLSAKKIDCLLSVGRSIDGSAQVSESAGGNVVIDKMHVRNAPKLTQIQLAQVKCAGGVFVLHLADAQMLNDKFFDNEIRDTTDKNDDTGRRKVI